MRQITVLMVIIISTLLVSSSATIINIPDDYATIQQGIDASSDGDTVLVQPGTYVENINFNGHNIVLGSLFLTTGDTSYIEETVIDGDQSGNVVIFEMGEDSTTVITGFTIQHGYSALGAGLICFNSSPKIIGNLLQNNSADDFGSGTSLGGGIYCINSSSIIFRNRITENVAEWGGGLYLQSSYCLVKDNIFYDNDASGLEELSDAGGGGIFINNSFSIFTNNVLHQNGAYAGLGSAFGGGIYSFISNAMFINNLLFHNTSDSWPHDALEEIRSFNSVLAFYNTIIWPDENANGIIYTGSPPIVTYCDIKDGWAGEGNIDVDPLFRNPDEYDFHLMAIECGDSVDSPCIDAGHPDSLDAYLDCQWGLGAERSDMGAYGGNAGPQTDIRERELIIPRHFMLMQNYPNPFNPATTITFSLPKQQLVTLMIYNLLGREVQMLINEQRQTGMHTVTFDASHLSSGIYFYRLQAGDYTETKKMILLK